jgi:hypothetical protein
MGARDSCRYLNSNNRWYLSTNTCLDHKHHPKLNDQAITLSQKDMPKQEIKLLNVLHDINVPPSKISTILDMVRDDDNGTFLSKTLFNINERSRNLIDLANGILPTCSDAENSEIPTPVSSICDVYFLCFNIIYVLLCFVLFSKDIDHYCAHHVTGHGLFSQANGTPKGDSHIKLPCSDSMQSQDARVEERL